MKPAMEELVQELEGIHTSLEFETWKKNHALSPELVQSITARIQHQLSADVRAAARLADWCVAIADELQDPASRARALRAKGGALLVLNENLLSLEHFNTALALFEELDNEVETAKTRMNRVYPNIYLSRFEEALDDARIAGGIFEKMGEEILLARNFLVTGYIYFRLDRFEESLATMNKAEGTALRLKDGKILCILYVNRAVTLTSLNRPAEAFKYFELARQLAIENDMPLNVSECDYNICYLYFLQGQYTQALERLNAVRQYMQACGDRKHSALCNLDQSEIYLELNMHQDAIELAQQAYDAFEPLGMTYEKAKAVAFMGIAYNHLRNHGKALELFDRARRMFHRQGNQVWLTLIDLYQSIVYFQTGRHFEGLDLAQHAYLFFAQEGLTTKATYARLLVARLHLQLRQLEDAWREANECLGTLGESPAPWLRYQIQYVLGDVLAAKHDLQGARSAYRCAIEELEVLRTNIRVDELRMTFLKDKLKIYEALVCGCLEIGDPESRREAFESVERAKSRTLVDLLANNINAVRPNTESDSQLVNRLRNIREELNWYYTRINLEEQKGVPEANKAVQILIEEVRKREDQLIRLLRQLPGRTGDYASLHRVTTSSLEEIQQSLPEDAVLVEYYMIEGRVLAFTVTRDGFEVFPGVSLREALRTTFELFRFQITKFNLGRAYTEKFSSTMLRAVTEHLQELYKELVAPIESALSGRKSIIFVPHDFLHYLPFQALFDGERYLIDRFEISYSPSASIYCSYLGGIRRPGSHPLVMGVPDERTPHIRDEVENIRSIFADAEVFLGPDATVERLQNHAEKSSLIHIASHGSFRYDNPMFSAIQLGDTWLNLFDIYNLKTSARLVTLSGCGTGMSSVVAGDELLGLVRGFLYAGARSLLVSLWDVHDRTTADLMRTFYSNLAAGATRWESLRSAMLDLKKEFPHPYYWAPFILIGGTT